MGRQPSLNLVGSLVTGWAMLANAQTPGPVTVTFIPGSTAKLEQLIGDQDYQTKAPTASQTVSRYNILGNDIGYSFEDNGKLFLSFGDTTGPNADYQAHDTIATSTVTSGEAGLLLNFFTNSNGTPLFVEPPGVAMGPDDVPNSGISLPDGVYFICNTGANTSLPNPHVNDVSLLAHFDETTQKFTTGRTLSKMPSGHFIITANHTFGSNVVMFGEGAYRASDIYLQMTPVSSFASGAGTQYFTGLANGQPTWSASESDAVPVVQDNPLNGPAWPNDSPSVGNIGIAYSSALGLWLMTYDGGRQSAATTGAYFTYAAQPWGPWAKPQLIFNAVRDKGLGNFIHNPAIVPDPPGDGLNGPTIGNNDIYATRGGDYAPNIIERFTTVAGNILKIYYTMSTWNPYTIVKMRSEFTLAPLINSGGIVIHAGTAAAISPGSLADIYGIGLAPATASAPAGATLPNTLGGVQVLVNNVAAPLIYVSPLQVIFQLPYEAVVGTASVTVVANGTAGPAAPVSIQQSAPEILLYGNNRAVAFDPNGSLNGPGNGASPGAVMVMYLMGSGPLDHAIPTGTAALTSPLSNESLPTTVAVGNSAAVVQFAGMTPGYEGLVQVNFVMPNLTPGDYPVQVTIGSISSNQPVITVSK